MLHDEAVGIIPLLSGLLALRVAPRAEEVLASATGLGAAFTTTVRVVDGVHAHAADGGADAEPAGAPGLAADDVHVFDVADLSDSGVARGKDLADLTGGELHQGVVAFHVGHDGSLAGGAGDLATLVRRELDVVNLRAERDLVQRQRVADLGLRFLTGHHLGADGEIGGREDVALLAVPVLDERNARGAVRIVLDA